MGFGEVVPIGLRNRRFAVASALVGGLLLVAGGCALLSGTSPPQPAQEAAPELPADFTESPATGALQAQEWWRAFADPALDHVVESVLDSNFSVAEAVARVEQARTRARLADAATLHETRLLGTNDPKQLAVYAIEIDIIEKFKRIYYFSKRMAKTVGPQAAEARAA